MSDELNLDVELPKGVLTAVGSAEVFKINNKEGKDWRAVVTGAIAGEGAATLLLDLGEGGNHKVLMLDDEGNPKWQGIANS